MSFAQGHLVREVPFFVLEKYRKALILLGECTIVNNS